MFFYWPLYLKALRISLLEHPFRARRWVAVLFFSLLLGFMRIIVAFGRMLDHVFFPGFKQQQVRTPVFIVAPPRSGTTLLQKLMAKDTERFSCVRLYQTIFPAITWYKCFEVIGRADAHCGKIFSRFAAWIERTFFRGWDSMHALRFNEPEEDDGFFVYTFVTEAIYLLFPYVDELWGAGFVDDLPENVQRKVMIYYRTCLQRHLFATGPDKTLLSKATQFSGAIHALRREFPDSRIVTIHRDPEKSIASHVNVFYVVWKVLFPGVAKDGPESKGYARLAVAWFRHVHETSMSLEHFYSVQYDEFVADPKRTILKLYRGLGYEAPPEFLKSLEQAGDQQKMFRSSHRYSPGEFGLSEEWFRAELGDVIDAWAEPKPVVPAACDPVDDVLPQAQSPPDRFRRQTNVHE